MVRVGVEVRVMPMGNAQLSVYYISIGTVQIYTYAVCIFGYEILGINP